QPGGLSRPGRRLGRGRGGAGLRRARRPLDPPRARRLALGAGPPPLGVRLPTHLRRRPQPDRALAEGAAPTRPERAAGRDVGRGLPGRRAGHRLRERPPPPLRLGPPHTPPRGAPPRPRPPPVGRTALPTGPLRHWACNLDEWLASSFELGHRVLDYAA